MYQAQNRRNVFVGFFFIIFFARGGRIYRRGRELLFPSCVWKCIRGTIRFPLLSYIFRFLFDFFFFLIGSWCEVGVVEEWRGLCEGERLAKWVEYQLLEHETLKHQYKKKKRKTCSTISVAAMQEALKLAEREQCYTFTLATTAWNRARVFATLDIRRFGPFATRQGRTAMTPRGEYSEIGKRGINWGLAIEQSIRDHSSFGVSRF